MSGLFFCEAFGGRGRCCRGRPGRAGPVWAALRATKTFLLNSDFFCSEFWSLSDSGGSEGRSGLLSLLRVLQRFLLPRGPPKSRFCADPACFSAPLQPTAQPSGGAPLLWLLAP